MRHSISFVGISLLLISCTLMSCSAQRTRDEVVTMGTLNLTSPAFEHMEEIPAKYTCQGDDINPPLKIGGIPGNAASLVLIVDDPDAPMGTWNHWVMWNIPLISSIPEDSVPAEAVQGLNSWPKNKYGGPCPPSGTHRYFFKLYALDTKLTLGNGSGKKDVAQAMQGHIISQATLIGLYKKK